MKSDTGSPADATVKALHFQQTRHRFHWAEAIPWILAISVYYMLPGYRLLATQILVLILFALSLDLIVGYAGIVSLGHTAFFGTGAYVTALLASHDFPDPVFGLFAAAVAAALLGVISGWVLLRTVGLTLLVLTMAVTIMLQELANDFDEITGGFDGINFTNSEIFGLIELDQLWYSSSYFYALVVLFIGFLLIRTIVYAPFGRVLIGIRENPQRMSAIGTPVHQRKVIIYTISAAIAGVAGALWVQVQGNVTTEVYAFGLSGDLLIMLILGGVGRLYGAFLGTIIYKILESTTELILGTDQPYWQFTIGILLILTVLFARRGLLGIFEDIVRKRKGGIQ